VYSIELSNPTSAPLEVDLAATKLEYISMVDGSSVTAITVNGGFGAPPGDPPRPSPPPRVVLAPKETRAVWLGFSIPDDARLAHVRREQLTLPSVGPIVINDISTEHPNGVRTYRGRRRALSIVARSSVDFASNGRLEFSEPYEAGAALLQCQLRVDAHVAGYDHFASTTTNYTRAKGLAVGLGATWSVLHGNGIYVVVDYERISPEGGTAENAVVLGAGLSLPFWVLRPGTAYGNWTIPIASFRLGGVATIADSGTVAALRVGLEISPPWRW